MKQFTAMVYARTMEFVRDRGTFIWNLFLPIMLVFGFSFVFSDNSAALFKVGTMGTADSSLSIMKVEGIEFIPYDLSEERTTAEKVLDLLRRHELDMVVDFGAGTFYLNSESAASSVLRRLMTGVDGTATEGMETVGTVLREATVSGEPVRYVDRLVPGVIGMNMLFSCMFGVGYVIVRYRKNGVLKRLKATPVTPLSFVSAQVVSRLVIVAITSVLVYIGTNIFLGFMMKGSYLNLILLMLLSIICMISLGLVFAARFKSEELASGMMNLVTLPMVMLSGVFVSMEGSHEIVQAISQALPLTHFVDAARNIMIDGAGLAEIAPHLLTLGGMSVVFLVISSLLFKWE